MMHIGVKFAGSTSNRYIKGNEDLKEDGIKKLILSQVSKAKLI